MEQIILNLFIILRANSINFQNAHVPDIEPCITHIVFRHSYDIRFINEVTNRAIRQHTWWEYQHIIR